MASTPLTPIAGDYTLPKSRRSAIRGATAARTFFQESCHIPGLPTTLAQNDASEADLMGTVARCDPGAQT